MQKWEYLTWELPIDSNEPDHLGARLTEYWGNEGWELISVVPSSWKEFEGGIEQSRTKDVTLFFKRPKQEG